MVKLFFILGGPGCGKGTQSSLLAQTFSCLHLSAGQLLRDASHIPEVKSYLSQGLIVPSHITIELLKKQIQHEKDSQTMLIDGFPRNFENLEGFLQTQIPISGCIYIKLPEDIMKQRILLRKEGRSDDNEQTFSKRIKVFQQETIPVLEWFKNQNKLFEIDGDGAPNKVQSRIIENVFN